MNKVLLPALVIFISSCSVNSKITHNSTSRSITSLDYSLNALLWQQRSGEYRALCYQAFNTARVQLDEILQQHSAAKPLALVTDIDESILDNSPEQANDLMNKTTYTEESWIDWTDKAIAKALPGAVEFFNYANSKGVNCFYISNRRPIEKETSIKNLRQAGFPQADSIHVMMKGESSDKEGRRELVSKDYTIVMLIGDNLNDFDKQFYKQNAVTRSSLADSSKQLFGTKFIVLPNPLYGDWESAIWNGEKISAKEALKRKKDALITY